MAAVDYSALWHRLKETVFQKQQDALAHCGIEHDYPNIMRYQGTMGAYGDVFNTMVAFETEARGEPLDAGADDEA
jgi:hypothetical protein